MTGSHRINALRQGAAFYPEVRRAAVPEGIEKPGVSTPACAGRPEVGRKDGRVIDEIGPTAAIRTLQPNVTQSEAVRLFSAGGIAGALRRLHHGPLQRIADVYVPFWICRVRYQMGRVTESRFFALDAVHGSLDLFEFPEVPEAAHLVTIQTRNFLQPKLETAQAENLLREKALRVIFLEGFFKLRRAHLEVVREPIELHVPYWLGFYGNYSRAGDHDDGRTHSRWRGGSQAEHDDQESRRAQVGNQGHVYCRVLDALRRRFEGPKASAFFESWIAA